jgi:phosphotransacetylase
MSTPILNQRMLKLAVRSTVSLVTVFDAAPIADGRIVLMTDAGFTTVCTIERMADMVTNAADVARVVLGIPQPRVAILSANEKLIGSLPSTKMGFELAQRDWPDAVVCGPLSLDLATDPESVEVKGIPDLPNAQEVAGRADILVCPNLESANVLYKMLTAMNKYGQASLASITMGFMTPYSIISRADTMETRMVSIALCSIYAQRVRGGGADNAKTNRST